MPVRHSLQITQMILQQRYPNGFNGTDEEIYKKLETDINEINDYIRHENISKEEISNLRIEREVLEDEARYYRKRAKE